MEHPQQPAHQHMGLPQETVIRALTDCAAACAACEQARHTLQEYCL